MIGYDIELFRMGTFDEDHCKKVIGKHGIPYDSGPWYFIQDATREAILAQFR